MDNLNSYEPIKRQNITEEIIDRFLELVRNGHLAPNEKLASERELGERFGVSRTVIREALQGLTSMGVLVKDRSNLYVCSSLSNIIVKPISVLIKSTPDIMNLKILFEARLAIESQIVRIAAMKATEDEILRLEECLDNAKNSPDVEAMQYSVEFHQLICECTRNPILQEMFSIIFNILQEMRSNERSLEQVRFSQRIHREILEAIRNHDPDRAEKVVIKHLTVLKEVLETTSALENGNTDSMGEG